VSARAKREAIQRQEEQQERQRDFQREQQTLQQAFNQQGQLSRGWMREILDTDDLENYLQPYTIDKIQAMLNKQWVLANLTDAETHDRIYKLEVMKYKILGEHPPEESSIQGPLRAFLFDEEMEGLWALTAQERNTIDQIITTLQNMVTRSRGGFERKQINTNIARTETESNGKDEKKGGYRGLFGGR
jgi:hypothetical protein